MGFGDIAATKKKAEAGDPQAQLSLADVLVGNYKKAEALQWYRTAAEQGSVEAKSRLGEMLLFGGTGIPANQSVKAIPTEGIRWTFEAATNRNAKAYLNMSRAFQSGIGVSTNLIAAYAWLQLYSESGSVVGRAWLNDLALKLDVKSIESAQLLAARYRAGLWPSLSPRAIAEGDTRLKLTGVTLGKNPVASINGRTLTEGESVKVLLEDGHLEIICLRIKQNAVLIRIAGEHEPRWLTMK